MYGDPATRYSRRASYHGLCGLQEDVWQRFYALNAPHAGVSRVINLQIDAPPRRLFGASKAAAERFSERGVLHNADYLDVRLAEAGQDLDQLQSPEIVDVLDWIIEHEAIPFAPRPR